VNEAFEFPVLVPVDPTFMGDVTPRRPVHQGADRQRPGRGRRIPKPGGDHWARGNPFTSRCRERAGCHTYAHAVGEEGVIMFQCLLCSVALHHRYLCKKWITINKGSPWTAFKFVEPGRIRQGEEEICLI